MGQGPKGQQGESIKALFRRKLVLNSDTSEEALLERSEANLLIRTAGCWTDLRTTGATATKTLSREDHKSSAPSLSAGFWGSSLIKTDGNWHHKTTFLLWTPTTQDVRGLQDLAKGPAGFQLPPPVHSVLFHMDHQDRQRHAGPTCILCLSRRLRLNSLTLQVHL